MSKVSFSTNVRPDGKMAAVKGPEPNESDTQNTVDSEVKSKQRSRPWLQGVSSKGKNSHQNDSLKRSDTRFKEIKRQLMRRAREKDNKTDDAVEEYYVDSYRMISVHIGADADLKNVMQKSGLRLDDLSGAELCPGRPNYIMFCQLADHYVSKNQYHTALHYLDKATILSPSSQVVLMSKAKVQLKLGKWLGAFKSAEDVLKEDKNNWRALLVKAESLFNLCHFERAMVIFYQGQAQSHDAEDFRLGIQKCKKIITDVVNKKNAFEGDGLSVMFNLLRRMAIIRMEDKSQFSSKLTTKKRAGLKGSLGSSLWKLSNALKGDQTATQCVPKKNDKPMMVAAEAKLKDDEIKAQLMENVLDAPAMPEVPESPASKVKRRKRGSRRRGTDSKRWLLKQKQQQQQQQQQGQLSSPRALPLGSMKSRPAKALRIKKSPVASDRLLDDKAYLQLLIGGKIKMISNDSNKDGGFYEDEDDDDFEQQVDEVSKRIKSEAKEALDFLMKREDFWDQLDMGSKIPSSEGSNASVKFRALESSRSHSWLLG